MPQVRVRRRPRADLAWPAGLTPPWVVRRSACAWLCLSPRLHRRGNPPAADRAKHAQSFAVTPVAYRARPEAGWLRLGLSRLCGGIWRLDHRVGLSAGLALLTCFRKQNRWGDGSGMVGTARYFLTLAAPGLAPRPAAQNKSRGAGGRDGGRWGRPNLKGRAQRSSSLSSVSSARWVKVCMLASRSALPVASVRTRRVGPSTARQAWPAGSP
jgi:hypothetical protein